MPSESGLQFSDVLTECTHNREFREEYNRLCRARIGKWPERTPQAVKEKEFARFAAFVHEVVWMRLPLAEVTPEAPPHA